MIFYRHYPTTKFTAVADTPENMRLKKNTQQQSAVMPSTSVDLENIQGRLLMFKMILKELVMKGNQGPEKNCKLI